MGEEVALSLGSGDGTGEKKSIRKSLQSRLFATSYLWLAFPLGYPYSQQMRRINLKLPSGSQVLWLLFLGAPEGGGKQTFLLFGKSPGR